MTEVCSDWSLIDILALPDVLFTVLGIATTATLWGFLGGFLLGRIERAYLNGIRSQEMNDRLPWLLCLILIAALSIAGWMLILALVFRGVP